MSFTPYISRDTEEVIAVVEIWRQNYNDNSEKTEYVPIMKIQPYYRWWISEEGLKSYDEATNWFMKTKQFASKIDLGSGLVTATRTFSEGVKGILLDTSNKAAIDVLGVQIDVTGKFGNRTEISFADQTGLIYRTVRKNDLIFIWLIDMKDANWLASFGGSVGMPILDKAAVALYYEKSADFKIDWKKDFKKENLLEIRNNPISLLQKGNIRRITEISDKLKGQTINRPRFPNFAGFITVKRRHVARTGQFRALCQDPIRYFQHYKFNFKKIDDSTDFYAGPFYTLILEPLLRDYYRNRAINNRNLCVYESNIGYKAGVVFKEKYKLKIIKMDSLEFFNAILDLSIASSTSQLMTYFDEENWNKNRNTFYHLVVDDIIKKRILDCPKLNNVKDKDIYIAYYFKPSGLTADEIVAIRLYNKTIAWDKKKEEENELITDTYPTTLATEVLMESFDNIYGQINTSGIIVQRDPSDIHSNMGGGQPSIFDIFETFIHNLATKQYGTRYNVRRALWSKSFSFISKDTFVSLFYYRFCGRDLETLEVVNSDNSIDKSLRARFNIHQSDIDELDIWEVNTELTSNEGKFSGSKYSAKVSFTYKSSSNNSTKVISLGSGDISPFRTFRVRNLTGGGKSIVNNSITEGIDELKREIETIKNHLNFLENTDRGKVFRTDKTLVKFSDSSKIFGNEKMVIKSFKAGNITMSLGKEETVNKFLFFANNFVDKMRNITSTIAQYYKGFINDDNTLLDDVTAERIIGLMNVTWITNPDVAANEAYRHLSYHYITNNSRTLDDNFILDLLNYKYTSFRNEWLSDLNFYAKMHLTKHIVSLKRSFIQYILLIIRTGLYSIIKFIYGLTSFSGKNGSLYMSARPLIDIGDEIILWKEGGDGLIRRAIDRKYGDSEVGTIYKTTKRILGGLTTGKNSADNLFRAGSSGKIFYEDYIDKGGGDFIWYVWKHVIYVGNFGVTSGFTSKIYLTDEPLNFGTQFLDDNVVTRQLANFLFESGLGGQYPQEIRRLLGV